ncbi:MAG: zinc dependent phospholipase C family protein [Geobacteraceae bacterium]|nr:zinc dependent phospholipase C family protein [Geobacteraceae bacterium]
MTIYSLLALLLTLLLFPEQAHAWGGGIHLQLGATVLGNLPALSPGLAALLEAHPNDFLYGCISADITLGKKFTHSMLNCHRWRIGQKVLQASRTDSQRACAYGYLCHLAADVIAHNYFVPYKIMRSFASVTMKHAYWEMRFETFVAKDIWETAQNVCRADQQANDALLRGVLTNTIFSFGTNKRIFNSIMLLSRLEKWQAVMKTLSDNSRYQLAESDREEYLKLTEEAVYCFLLHPGDSEILLADPTGERALAMAEAVRKNLRLLYRSGKLTKTEGMEQVELLKMKLRLAMQTPEVLEGLFSGTSG